MGSNDFTYNDVIKILSKMFETSEDHIEEILQRKYEKDGMSITPKEAFDFAKKQKGGLH